MKKPTKIDPSARAPQDLKDLARGISICEDPDEKITFKEWQEQLMGGVIADLGPNRRRYLREFIAGTEDAMKAAGMKLVETKSAPKRPNDGQRIDFVRRLESEVLCGPLPKFPPGMTADSPRFVRRP